MFDLVFLRCSHAHASHSGRMCGFDMHMLMIAHALIVKINEGLHNSDSDITVDCVTAVVGREKLLAACGFFQEELGCL